MNSQSFCFRSKSKGIMWWWLNASEDNESVKRLFSSWCEKLVRIQDLNAGELNTGWNPKVCRWWKINLFFLHIRLKYHIIIAGLHAVVQNKLSMAVKVLTNPTWFGCKMELKSIFRLIARTHSVCTSFKPVVCQHCWKEIPIWSYNIAWHPCFSQGAQY